MIPCTLSSNTLTANVRSLRVTSIQFWASSDVCKHAQAYSMQMIITGKWLQGDSAMHFATPFFAYAAIPLQDKTDERHISQ